MAARLHSSHRDARSGSARSRCTRSRLALSMTVAMTATAFSLRVVAADLSGDITRAIQPIAEKMATKYNCAVSVAVYKDGDAGFDARVAGGYVNQYDAPPQTKVSYDKQLLLIVLPSLEHGTSLRTSK